MSCAARLVVHVLPVTAAVRPVCLPLAQSCLSPPAATPTLAAGTPGDDGTRQMIAVGEISRVPDLSVALGLPPAAVEQSPVLDRARGQLLRQTQALGTAAGGWRPSGSVLAAARRPGSRPAARARRTAAPGAARRTGRGRAGASVDPPRSSLTDPARRNVFSAARREALLDAMLLPEADETIESVEPNGAGPALCSGGDLDESGTVDDLVAARLFRLFCAPWRVIDRIAAKGTVAAHGACIGAGTELRPTRAAWSPCLTPSSRCRRSAWAWSLARAARSACCAGSAAGARRG